MIDKNSQIVYSTDPDFVPAQSSEEPAASKSLAVRMSLDRKNRAGKSVTVLEGFSESAEDLERLAKHLKTKCATGGTVKARRIEIQGDHRAKIEVELQRRGYRVKRVGG